ncbi:hypothetical protein PO592_24480, partial [Klebsiella pneumoniae]
SVRHIFKPISYLEIQLLSGVSGGYIKWKLYRSKLGDRDTFTSPGLAVTLLSFKSMMIEVQRPLLARIERR